MARRQVSLDCKVIKPVNSKGNQPWIFIGRTDAEAPIVWPPDAKSQLIGKHCDAGKDRRQEEKGATEDKMFGWHHQLNGHKFDQAPGEGEGQGSLVCCSPLGRKESDTTEQLNWSKFRKLEETADILTQGRVFKRPPTNFKDENYNVWNEKYTDKLNSGLAIPKVKISKQNHKNISCPKWNAGGKSLKKMNR